MDSNVYLAVGIGFVTAMVFYTMVSDLGLILSCEARMRAHIQRLCGPMDKAPAYGAGDCRFESCLSQSFLL